MQWTRRRILLVSCACGATGDARTTSAAVAAAALSERRAPRRGGAASEERCAFVVHYYYYYYYYYTPLTATACYGIPPRDGKLLECPHLPHTGTFA